MAFVKTVLVLMGVATLIQGLAAGLNDTCSSDSECSLIENAVCSVGKCTCKTGTIDYDNKCLNVANKFGDSCVTVKQCNPNLGSDVECFNSKCSCKEGGYVVATIQDKQRCVRTLHLNEECQVSAQCILTNNSECIDQKCACKPGFSDAQNIKCLPNRKQGEMCEEHSQCNTMSGRLAGCRNKTCMCEDLAYYNGSMCLKKNGLGESCRDSLDGCYTEVGGDKYIECSNGVCSCKSGTKESTKGAYCESGVGRALVSIGLLLAALVSCSSI